MSDEDARVDAARWLDARLGDAPVPPLLVVLGLGDGALLDVLDARAPHTRVLALEPDAAQTARFRSRDWTQWLRDGRLVYLVDPDYTGADEAWRLFPPTTDAPVVLTHPAIARNPGPEAVRAARVLKTIVFGAQANATARQQFAPGYLLNSLRNAPALGAGRDVRDLTDVFAGRPAVIAAAGPSLDAVVPELRKVHERAVLIAVDTALRPLLNTGARPHLAVGLDPSALNARHFRALPPCPDTWLVSESALDAAAHRHFGERSFWFRVANHDPWPWYQELGLDVGLIEVWGSVVTAAFQVAVLAGCDPIVFVGTDLAYTDGRPYARRTTYEYEWARQVAAGADLAQLWQAWTKVHAPVQAIDLNGRETRTSAPLLAFRDWLLARAARSGRRIINATGAGMFFGGGVEQKSLAESLRHLGPVTPPTIDAGRASMRLDRRAWAARFRDLADALASGTVSPPVERWADFSGRGWNPSAVVAALVATAQSFGHEAPAVSTAAVPAIQADLLARLPEAVERWRATLQGATPLRADMEPLGADDAARRLLDAAELLARLSAPPSCHDGDVVATACTHESWAPPTGVEYAWPLDLAWQALLIEGHLGLASWRPMPPPSYFDRPLSVRESSGGRTVPVRDRPACPDTLLACARLAMHWAACAANLAVDHEPDRRATAAQWLALGSMMRTAGHTARESVDADVEMVLHGPEGLAVQRWPVTVDLRAAARLETGTIWTGQPPGLLTSSMLEAISRSASVRDGASAATVSVRVHAHQSGALEERVRVQPRVLTDIGVPHANIAYADHRGVVCVSAGSSRSFVVRADGTIEAGGAWPRAIVNELVLGDHGTAAWSTGAVEDGRLQPAYVMFRSAADAPVSFEELPFQPTWGTWWREQLYWTCCPAGIGSWAPGGQVDVHLAGLTVVAIEAAADALLLSPGTRGADGHLLRRRALEVWRWTGNSGPSLIPLGPAGAATSCATGSHGWAAAAFAEADLVRLDAPDGEAFSMIVPYPFKLAWLGDALLVSTISAELLFFPDLVSRIDAAGAGGSRS